LASHLVAITDPNSLGAEKFRALAIRLDHVRKQRQFKSLQVTSSVVNEGKTLVSANLAVTLAKYSCSRTLLIEGDLHRPALASLFGLRELQGLSHWWSARDQDIGCFLQQLNDMPLCFLAAGKAHDQPSDILHSAHFARAFEHLVDQFDWIVVDSPPMLPVVDVNLWSRLVDGALLVVRAGVTPVKALKKGLQALDHPNVVGVLLNEAADVDQVKYEGRYYGGEKTFGSATKDSSR
jgi:capsular exopolysaccharide synthesis family protein